MKGKNYRDDAANCCGTCFFSILIGKGYDAVMCAKNEGSTDEDEVDPYGICDEFEPSL